jgi:hypothetical protein
MSIIRERWNKESALTGELLIESSRKGSKVYQAIETVLKGLEIPLQKGFIDKDGTYRSEVRIMWWLNNPTFKHEAVLPPGTIKSSSKEKMEKGVAPGYHPDHAPVFVGHYWWRGNPEPLEDNVACLDYSVAKGGALVAYRWSGPGKLVEDNFVAIPSIPR